LIFISFPAVARIGSELQTDNAAMQTQTQDALVWRKLHWQRSGWMAS